MTLTGIPEWFVQRAGIALLPADILLGAFVACSAFAFAYMLITCLRRRPSFKPFEAIAGLSPWTSVDIRVLLLYFLGFSLFFMTLLIVLHPGDDEKAHSICTFAEAMLMATVLAHGTMALYIGGRLRKMHMTTRTFLGINPPQRPVRLIVFAVILFLAALPVIQIASGLWNQVLIHLGLEFVTQPAIAAFEAPGESVWVLGLLAVFATVTGPVLEEAIFRGIILPIVTRQFGAGYAITIVSMFFALLHPIHLWPPIFLIAVSFSLGYVWSGSLLVPMIMHACFNATQLLVLYLIPTAATTGIGP